jgi:hypothetical protein
LEREWPKLSWLERLRTRMIVPLALKFMQRLSVRWEIYSELGLPKPKALAREVRRSLAWREHRAKVFARFIQTMEQLGLLAGLHRLRWRWLGLAPNRS